MYSHRNKYRQKNKSTGILQAFIITFVNPCLSTIEFSPLLLLVNIIIITCVSITYFIMFVLIFYIVFHPSLVT